MIRPLQCGWRPHIEDALELDIWRLRREGFLCDGASGKSEWLRSGKHIATLAFTVANETSTTATLTLQYPHAAPGAKPYKVVCKIALTSIPLNYGGLRWYALCPYTERRARKLYKFSQIEKFCHRTAVRPLPTYASQRTSGVKRIIGQRWALRQKIGDEVSDLFGQLCKPKGIWRKTFEHYAACDAEMAEREWSYMPRLFRRKLG